MKLDLKLPNPSVEFYASPLQSQNGSVRHSYHQKPTGEILQNHALRNAIRKGEVKKRVERGKELPVNFFYEQSFKGVERPIDQHTYFRTNLRNPGAQFSSIGRLRENQNQLQTRNRHATQPPSHNQSLVVCNGSQGPSKRNSIEVFKRKGSTEPIDLKKNSHSREKVQTGQGQRGQKVLKEEEFASKQALKNSLLVEYLKNSDQLFIQSGLNKPTGQITTHTASMEQLAMSQKLRIHQRKRNQQQHNPEFNPYNNIHKYAQVASRKAAAFNKQQSFNSYELRLAEHHLPKGTAGFLAGSKRPPKKVEQPRVVTSNMHRQPNTKPIDFSNRQRLIESIKELVKATNGPRKFNQQDQGAQVGDLTADHAEHFIEGGITQFQEKLTTHSMEQRGKSIEHKTPILTGGSKLVRIEDLMGYQSSGVSPKGAMHQEGGVISSIDRGSYTQRRKHMQYGRSKHFELQKRMEPGQNKDDFDYGLVVETRAPPLQKGVAEPLKYQSVDTVVPTNQPYKTVTKMPFVNEALINIQPQKFEDEDQLVDMEGQMFHSKFAHKASAHGISRTPLINNDSSCVLIDDEPETATKSTRM